MCLNLSGTIWNKQITQEAGGTVSFYISNLVANHWKSQSHSSHNSRPIRSCICLTIWFCYLSKKEWNKQTSCNLVSFLQLFHFFSPFPTGFTGVVQTQREWCQRCEICFASLFSTHSVPDVSAGPSTCPRNVPVELCRLRMSCLSTSKAHCVHVVFWHGPLGHLSVMMKNETRAHSLTYNMI